MATTTSVDERAFAQLTDPYRRALEIHCYRMLGSAQDAEDMVQETLLRAWRGLGRFEQRASMRTWLYRIATNACLDELERRPHRPLPVQPYPDARIEEASEPTVDPAARYAAREGMELALLTAIRQLPGRQRAILLLRDVLGWTAPEVAELLDTTVAATTSALQRARATIDPQLVTSPKPAGALERDLLRRYVDAWERVDVDGLVALMREDAELRMPPQPSVHGARDVAAWLCRGATGGGSSNATRALPAWANGRPALVMHLRRPGGALEPHGVLVLDVAGGRVRGLDAFIDPALPGLFGVG